MTIVGHHFRRFLWIFTGHGTVQALESGHKDTSRISEMNLLAGRFALASGAFDEAFAAYVAAEAEDNGNLECHIGIALCHFHRGQTSEALVVLHEARSHFGNHDAFLAILVKCYLRLFNWQGMESSWREWADALGDHPTNDFFHTTGKIRTALIRFNTVSIF
jgi:hypothetical protein